MYGSPYALVCVAPTVFPGVVVLVCVFFLQNTRSYLLSYSESLRLMDNVGAPESVSAGGDTSRVESSEDRGVSIHNGET